MQPPHILVVAIDGLRASALGAYGNTIYPTPALDRFAAESFLLDACYAPSPDLTGVYRAIWQSSHLAQPNSSSASVTFPRLLSRRGYTTTLVTDAPEVLSLAHVSHFDERLDLAASSMAGAVPVRAKEACDTSLGHLFATLCNAISSAPMDSPQLTWVHAQGMYAPWDAPIDLQHSLLDEGDPPPMESACPPSLTIGEEDDPDAPFRYACAYAAQIMVLDACWNGLLETLQSANPRRQWLVVLLGTRGYPLGEHRRIGGVDPRLYGEQLHVPWLMSFPDRRGALMRSARLTSPLDLRPTLLELGDVDLESDVPALEGLSIAPLLAETRPTWREALVAASTAGHRAIRTAEWCLRQDATGGRPELYVRPDDRWEVNDVAKLCPDVVEQLAQAMDGFFEQQPPR